MKINTHEEISFTNCHAGIYLSKNEGAVAIECKSQEIVLYLSTSLYQALAWLVLNAASNKELMSYVTWNIDPQVTSKTQIIEVHGPEHAACLVCAPSHERVQINLEIGVSIDLRFSDFKGLLELIQEAQDDLEWRRQLLKWGLNNDVSDNHKNNKDKKAI